MLTKNQEKLVKSLGEKKNRNELGLFLVEGEKSVTEVLNSTFEIDFLLITDEFFKKYQNLIEKNNNRYEIVSQDKIEKFGTLLSNDSALAVVKQSLKQIPETEDNEIVIALDTIQDPGNLGTIIRIADWYGIKKIIASEETADFYNPKVIGASMGSFTRVKVFYTNLKEFLSNTKLPVIGAYLNGENVHKAYFPKSGILLMGNESKGINKDLEEFITKKITIPSYGGAESLNVAIATAVMLDNWRK